MYKYDPGVHTVGEWNMERLPNLFPNLFAGQTIQLKTSLMWSIKPHVAVHNLVGTEKVICLYRGLAFTVVASIHLCTSITMATSFRLRGCGKAVNQGKTSSLKKTQFT